MDSRVLFFYLHGHHVGRFLKEQQQIAAAVATRVSTALSECY